MSTRVLAGSYGARSGAPALLADTSTAAFRKCDKYRLARFPELDELRREAFAAPARIEGVTTYQARDAPSDR